MKFHKDFQLNGVSFSNVEMILKEAKGISEEIFSFLYQWFDSNDFVKVNTSGSTGTPKVISLKKEFMCNSAIATGSYFLLPEKTNALLCLSADYIAGKMMLVRAITLGWHLDVVETNSRPLEKINKHYDFSAMVPMQLENSLEHMYKVRKLIVGGGVVSETLKEKIQKVPTEIFATYGMTETITHIAVKKINKLGSGLQQNFYKLLPKIEISLDNRGCLIINAPKLASEIIVTNDLVRINDKASFEWLGRFDSVINSGGIKLIPEQIERKLSKLIKQRFFVSSEKDNLLGEKLVLVIEGQTENIVEKSLILKFLGNHDLKKFEIPKVIYFIENFVETTTQKIQRSKTMEIIGKLRA